MLHYSVRHRGSSRGMQELESRSAGPRTAPEEVVWNAFPRPVPWSSFYPHSRNREALLSKWTVPGVRLGYAPFFSAGHPPHEPLSLDAFF